MNIQDLDVQNIGIFGDWHADRGYAVTAVDRAMSFLPSIRPDVLVHTGDFLAFEPYTTPFLKGLEKALAANDVHLYFIDGNHEDFPFLNSLSYYDNQDGTKKVSDHIHYLPRGFRWTWSEKSFLALGGATSVDVEHRRTGIDWFPDERITLGDAYRATQGGYVDVMFTHDVPSGTDVPPFKGEPWKLPEHIVRTANDHRALLGQVVDEVAPKMIFHGHYHNRYSAVRRNPNGQHTRIEGLDCNGYPYADNLELLHLYREER